jgi:integrase
MSLKNQKTTCSAIEWDDLLRLLDNLKITGNYKMLLLIGIGAYMGLRIGNIRVMKWVQLLNVDQVDVIENKTGKLRTVTINLALKELIRYCYSKLNVHTDSFIFSNSFGKPLSRQSLNKNLHKVLNHHSVAVTGGSSHCLRKSFGRRIWQSNNRSESALILLGTIFQHTNINTTKIYLGINKQEIAQLYLKI